jgi:hypothetical protein
VNSAWQLAVDLDRAQLGMDQGLVVGEPLPDLVLLPQLGELGAHLLQRPQQFARA